MNILKKMDTRKIQPCPPHLQTLAALPWEEQNSDFQLYSITILIKQLLLKSFPNSIHHFKTVVYGTLLDYITVSVHK